MGRGADGVGGLRQPRMAAADDDPIVPDSDAMRMLADTLVPRLLEGDDPRLDTLRTQWRAAAIRIVSPSPFGFHVDIAVPAELPRIAAPDQSGGNAVIPVEGIASPAGCVLSIVDGALACLEVYALEDWGTSPRFGAPGHVRPLALHETTSPVTLEVTMPLPGTTSFALRHCTAIRENRTWGHGVRLTLAATDNDPEQAMVFVCHPGHDEFAACQALPTQALIQRACTMLASGACDDALTRCDAAGTTLFFSLNMPRPTSA
jgi:hypothetical protein